ncbi:MAG: trypsin-like peptidase domain-containing protein [Opitutales bacterium]|nr:trypsin-like peptidase domain-containing protein [Opitutales bacterium]
MFRVFLSVFAAACASAQVMVFDLVDGTSVSARLLAEKPDRVYVDLGFTVVSIPRDAILQISDLSIEDRASVATEFLYREESGGAFMNVQDLVGRVGPAVVLVQTPTGLGSGFVIHTDGWVITNDHVIAGEHDLRVTVFEDPDRDGRGLERRVFENVQIVATSPEWDLALLRVHTDDPRRFETVPLGSSESLRQGQTVFAIGNPLGLERTVSEGIVSLRNRVINGNLFIQTTAEINPGNSGGPLFNLRGEVVGVNNMKVVGFGTEGLGFAIPAEVLKRFLRNRDAFAFDPRNPNSGFRYNAPPTSSTTNE